MATYKSETFLKTLEEKAYAYIDECLANTKEVSTGSGKVVKIRDRHIPTIDYFLRIWLPKNTSETIVRSTWYKWLNDEGDQSDTIKRIDNIFKSLATDIVANEGKGIFYAKNRLGMTDRIESKNENTNLNYDLTLNLE